MKEMPDLICGKAAVGGNYNSTRDNIPSKAKAVKWIFVVVVVYASQVNFILLIFADVRKLHDLY